MTLTSSSRRWVSEPVCPLTDASHTSSFSTSTPPAPSAPALKVFLTIKTHNNLGSQYQVPDPNPHGSPVIWVWDRDHPDRHPGPSYSKTSDKGLDGPKSGTVTTGQDNFNVKVHKLLSLLKRSKLKLWKHWAGVDLNKVFSMLVLPGRGSLTSFKDGFLIRYMVVPTVQTILHADHWSLRPLGRTFVVSCYFKKIKNNYFQITIKKSSYHRCEYIAEVKSNRTYSQSWRI